MSSIIICWFLQWAAAAINRRNFVDNELELGASRINKRNMRPNLIPCRHFAAGIAKEPSRFTRMRLN